jgi:hypothetical protein
LGKLPELFVVQPKLNFAMVAGDGRIKLCARAMICERPTLARGVEDFVGGLEV